MIRMVEAAMRPGATARHSSRPGRSAGASLERSRAVRGLALAAAVVLLQACGGATLSSWIEAPLIADGYTRNADYFPFEPTLLVNPDANAQLKFSYATLPSGTLTKLVVDKASTTASVGQEAYTLNADKVARARLVLYVEKVAAPGYIAIFSAHQDGADCFEREDTAPHCGQSVASADAAATDADSPAQPLRITTPGFYSFDVTKLVKYRLANNVESMMRVGAAPDPNDNTFGSFEFASKELPAGQAHVLHQPQLLITLSDAVGATRNAYAATSVRQSSIDPSVASRNFAQDENLWLSGVPGNRAYALIQPQSLPTGAFTLRTALNEMGSVGVKQTMVAFVNAPVPEQATAQPQANFYTRPGFTSQNQQVTSWNGGWTEPSAAALFATAPLDRDAQNQSLFVDASEGYVSALAGAYNADRRENFAIAGSTNLQAPLTLDSDNNTRTGHMPRFVAAITPVSDRMRNFMKFDRDDSEHTRNYCLALGDGMCNPSLSLRARLGQLFTRNPIVIDPRASTPEGSYLPYATPINVAVPSSGASAIIQSDPDPAEQGFMGDGGTGYYIYDARANRVAGQYQGIISMPGHNLRAVIHFENLPLPAPSLGGPGTIDMVPGAASVTVAANAPIPFRLTVADPVNANIDDTTRWAITSSNPGDTMPGEIQQSEGSAAFAATFAGPGSRTLTATSKGDGTIKTTMNVLVNQVVLPGQAITFTSTPPAYPVVGGAYAVSALGGGSGNPVVFTIDAASTAGACSVAGSVVTFAGAGTCTVNANQAGDANYAAAAQVQQTIAIPVTYSGTTVPTTGAGGPASASFTGGGAGCRFDPAATGFMAASAAPPGQSAPQGAFRVRLVDCTPGATVRVTTLWPQPVAGFTKYGRASSGAASASFFAPRNLTIDGNAVSFDLTDGQLGDDDWAQNGVIVDPVMPLAPAGLATAIPTLSEWGVVLTGATLAAMALLGLRRRRG